MEHAGQKPTKKNPRKTRVFHGRYWARTSDPQLVERGPTFVSSSRVTRKGLIKRLRTATPTPPAAIAGRLVFPDPFHKGPSKPQQNAPRERAFQTSGL